LFSIVKTIGALFKVKINRSFYKKCIVYYNLSRMVFEYCLSFANKFEKESLLRVCI